MNLGADPIKPEFESAYHARYKRNLYIQLFGQKGPLIRHLKRLKNTGTLLDVGCGQGWWLAEASKSFAVSGCDVSTFALSKARVNVPTANALALVDADGTLPFPDSSFDIVTAMDLIEHLSRPDVLVSEAFRVLKSDGIFALTTPNPKCVSAIVKPNTWHGVRDETHINIKTADEWQSLLARRGFLLHDRRYDGLWDVPYFAMPQSIAGVSKVAEHILIQLPSVLLYNLGFRFPERLGENTLLLARKRK